MAMQAFYIESTHPIHCSTCGEFRCHFSDIKEEDRQRCLESALLGMLICNPCKETVEPTPKQKEVASKPSVSVEPSPPKVQRTPKEALIEWLQRTAGCSEKCATAFAGILPRSFDAVAAKEGSPNVLAVMWEGASVLEKLPADAVSPAFKGKVYVLVSPHAYSLLHLRYASFSQAEANLSSAKNNSGYNLETCKNNVETTKKTLMKEIRKTVVKKTIDFQVPTMAPAGPEVQLIEEEEEEELIPEGNQQPQGGELKRPRDDEQEEQKKDKAAKRAVDRVSTTEGAISFLRRHGYTLVEARSLVTALRSGKNKGGKIVERLREKTVARLTFETITTLLTEGLIETDHVSEPFDSDKKTIQKGEHVCVVLIPDEQGLVYKTISQDRGQVKNIVDFLKPQEVSTFLSNFIEPEELDTCLQRLDMENPCYLNKAGDTFIIRLNSLLPEECQNEFVKASPFTKGTCYVAIENRARDGDEEEVAYDLMTNDILLNNDNKSFEDIATKWMQEVKNF